MHTYGIASKDTSPAHVAAAAARIFEGMRASSVFYCVYLYIYVFKKGGPN